MVVTVLSLAAMCAPVGAGPTARSAPPSAYDQLDPDRLAQKLKDLKMTELLEAMVGLGVKGTRGKALLAASLLSKALRTTDQEQRDKLLEQVGQLQRQLIRQTKDAKDGKGRVKHFRYRLDWIITQGIHKVDPYAERLQYFLGTAADRKAVLNYTKPAVEELERLLSEMEMQRDRWASDWEQWLQGNYQKLEAMMDEARYRGAWIRFYRAMVLSPDDATRAGLLEAAMADVKKFADAEDNSSGVKFTSLVLSGMAARELGEWERAKEFFQRADNPDARPTVRLKARFELVRVYIDRKQFTEANRQIEAFVAEAAKLPGLPKVAVAMQSALLRYKVLLEQGEALKDSDPKKAQQFRGLAGKELLKFVDKHPAYRDAFWRIIIPTIETADVKSLDPAMKLGLGLHHMGKETPEGDKKAEELFLAVADAQDAPDAIKASALWYLGLLKNRQRRNIEAAEYWCRLAENYPRDSNAKLAALNAVKSYEGIMQEKNKTARELGLAFQKKYVHALQVLVDNWGSSDPDILTRNYELGLEYDSMGDFDKAIKAFMKIPETSDLSLPARFRILSGQVKQLLESVTLSKALRRQRARSLIGDLSRYMTRARRYARRTKDPQRAQEVRSWAAECGFLIATLYKDILEDPVEAMQRVRELDEDPDLKGVPGVHRRAQELIVRMLLERGQVDKAIPMLTDLIKGDDRKGAESLLALAVTQTGEDMERLSYSDDPAAAAKLAELRKAYKLFAEKLYEFISGSDLPESQKASFKQALAHAYEFGTDKEVRKSLELYLALYKTKPNDAGIVRGIARAYRVLSASQQEPKKKAEYCRKAIEWYDKLIWGLPEKSAHWWRAQLEKWRYVLEVHRDHREALQKIPLQIKILSYKDRNMGGYWKQFRQVEGQAKARLRALKGAAPAGNG